MMMTKMTVMILMQRKSEMMIIIIIIITMHSFKKFSGAQHVPRRHKIVLVCCARRGRIQSARPV